MKLGRLKCLFNIHTVTIPEETERLATANPDNDFVVACDRCGMLAYAYFSKKRGCVRVYDTEAVFGDAWRD